ncbi:antileukoproteinase-like, partial [Lissotriton helveticus]
PGFSLVKKGVCPVSVPQCTNDYNCPGCQKCCIDCGYKCLDPVDNKLKKGMCPMAAAYCPTRGPDKCCVDDDCQKKQKCCLIICAKKCVDPLKDVYG